MVLTLENLFLGASRQARPFLVFKQWHIVFCLEEKKKKVTTVLN